jgi:hypothetical protein
LPPACLTYESSLMTSGADIQRDAPCSKQHLLV